MKAPAAAWHLPVDWSREHHAPLPVMLFEVQEMLFEVQIKANGRDRIEKVQEIAPESARAMLFEVPILLFEVLQPGCSPRQL